MKHKGENNELNLIYQKIVNKLSCQTEAGVEPLRRTQFILFCLMACVPYSENIIKISLETPVEVSVLELEPDPI